MHVHCHLIPRLLMQSNQIWSPHDWEREPCDWAIVSTGLKIRKQLAEARYLTLIAGRGDIWAPVMAASKVTGGQLSEPQPQEVTAVTPPLCGPEKWAFTNTQVSGTTRRNAVRGEDDTKCKGMPLNPRLKHDFIVAGSPKRELCFTP